jgi:molecular chaperone GrpE (heat shock protein)
MDEMDRADIRDANALAKKILGTKAPQLKEPSKRKQGKMPDPNMGLFDDFEFSRGTPVKGLTKAELEAELTAGMGEPVTGRKVEKQIADKLAVYENLDEYLNQFKDATRQKLKSQIPADAKGFVQNGKAVLFANNIGKGHGLGVLLHEVGVHLGFRNFFNEGQYNALVKTIKNWANKTEDSMEARVGKAAMRRVEAAETPENQIDDELLAYAVEEAMQMGVEPVGVKGGNAVKNWLKMVVDAFKKALEKFGITTSNLTAGDLVNFAYGAAHLELKGTWHGTGVKFDEFDHAYMSSGEGHQAFGFGTYRAQRFGTADYYRDVAQGVQLKNWLERPDVKAWRASQRPELIRKAPDVVPDWMLENAIEEAANAYAGISPHTMFKDSIESQIKDLQELRKDPNMQDVGFGIQTDKEFKDTVEKLKAFAKDAGAYIDAPFDKPLYKGEQSYSLYDTNPAAHSADRKSVV